MSIKENKDLDYYLGLLEKNMLFYGRDLSERLIVGAKGAYIFDHAGAPIIDFSSGQMCATLGHNHERIVEAMLLATREVIHLESTKIAPAVLDLAQKLAELTGGALTRSLFLSTGAESNEAAIKIAKLTTGGFEVVGIGNSWHGVTSGAASSTYSARQKSAGPTMPGTMALPEPNAFRCPIRHCCGACDTTCLDVGIEMVERQSTGAVSSVIVEPVQSAGGIIVTPQAYMEKLRAWCDRMGAMLIFDEAQTGLGRLGRYFGYEMFGFAPDVMTLSKTLGAGIPLAAVMTSDAVDETLREKKFNFYTSHVSDPFAAYVGCAVVDTIATEGLVERAAEAGRYLKGQLRELQAKYEIIGDVRGEGLLIGVEVVADRHTKRPEVDLLARITGLADAKGLSLSKTGGANAVWRMAPPLTITNTEIDSAIAILDDAITEAGGY